MTQRNTFAWYAEKYRYANERYPVTLKNFIVRYTRADNTPVEYRRATEMLKAPNLDIARRAAEAAIREKLCQEARVYDHKTTRTHVMTRGRREWRPPIQEE